MGKRGDPFSFAFLFFLVRQIPNVVVALDDDDGDGLLI
jgi:hypothetical protein